MVGDHLEIDLGTNRTQIQFDFSILWLTGVDQNGSAGQGYVSNDPSPPLSSNPLQCVTLSLSSLSYVVVASHACVAQIMI